MTRPLTPDAVEILDPEALARAFVEGSTEFDLEEIPPTARGFLVAWCREFIVWAGGRP